MGASPGGRLKHNRAQKLLFHFCGWKREGCFWKVTQLPSLPVPSMRCHCKVGFSLQKPASVLLGNSSLQKFRYKTISLSAMSGIQFSVPRFQQTTGKIQLWFFPTNRNWTGCWELSCGLLTLQCCVQKVNWSNSASNVHFWHDKEASNSPQLGISSPRPSCLFALHKGKTSSGSPADLPCVLLIEQSTMAEESKRFQLFPLPLPSLSGSVNEW